MFKKRKKNRRSKGEKITERALPITRYYKSSSVKPIKSVKDNDSNSSPTNIFAAIKKFVKKLPQRLLVIAIVALIIVNTTVSSVSVKVQDIQNSNTYRSLDDYKTGIRHIFDESLLNKSKFTLSSTKFENSIRELFPEVVKATVVVPLTGRKLQVGLILESPLLRLRRQTGQQGIVGETGKLLILTDTERVLETFSKLPSMVVEPNVEFEQGSQVLTSVETALLALLISEFDGSEVYRREITSITFQVEKREMQVNFEGVSYYAKLTPERDARAQVGALLVTLERLEEQGSLPGTYIDVRVEDRVFVK